MIKAHGTAFLTDNVEVTVRDSKGIIIDQQTTHNLITNSGRNVIRDVMAVPNSDTRGTLLNVYLAWGSGTTAAAAGDTALGSEASAGKKLITESNTATNYEILYKYYMSTLLGDGDTVAEVGLFLGNTTGDNTMLARAVLGSEIEKDTSKTITFQWTLTITAS